MQIAYAATALSVYLSYCGPAYMRSGQQQQAAPTGVHGEPHGSQQPNQPLSSSSDAVSSNIVRHRANTSLQQGNAGTCELCQVM